MNKQTFFDCQGKVRNLKSAEKTSKTLGRGRDGLLPRTISVVVVGVPILSSASITTAEKRQGWQNQLSQDTAKSSEHPNLLDSVLRAVHIVHIASCSQQQRSGLLVFAIALVPRML
jgi:hypothetical protein